VDKIPYEDQCRLTDRTIQECKPPVGNTVCGITYCGMCGKELKPERGHFWWEVKPTEQRT